MYRRVYSYEFRTSLYRATYLYKRIRGKLHLYDLKDYKRMKCYLSYDNLSGYAVKGDEVVNIFSLK